MHSEQASTGAGAGGGQAPFTPPRAAWPRAPRHALPGCRPTAALARRTGPRSPLGCPQSRHDRPAAAGSARKAAQEDEGASIARRHAWLQPAQQAQGRISVAGSIAAEGAAPPRPAPARTLRMWCRGPASTRLRVTASRMACSPPNRIMGSTLPCGGEGGGGADGGGLESSGPPDKRVHVAQARAGGPGTGQGWTRGDGRAHAGGPWRGRGQARPEHLQRALAADGLPRARHAALPVQANNVWAGRRGGRGVGKVGHKRACWIWRLRPYRPAARACPAAQPAWQGAHACPPAVHCASCACLPLPPFAWKMMGTWGYWARTAAMMRSA